MRNFSKLTAFISGLLLFNVNLFSQDSLSVFPWKVTSKKISDGIYELVFTTRPVDGWYYIHPINYRPISENDRTAI